MAIIDSHIPNPKKKSKTRASIDYCVQRQVDLIYMTPEYMAELHKFIYMSKDSDVDRLKEKAGNHLKYIPKRKLYRYRKCIDRELNLIEENAVLPIRR